MNLNKIFKTGFVASVLLLANIGYAQNAGDLMAPNSAQPMWIAGVNWGNVIDNPQTQINESDSLVTDRSISISGARLIPLPPDGVRQFKVEYGYGLPGQGNYGGSNFINETIITTSDLANPPYAFGGVINGLIPATDYYFNIWEMGIDQGNPISGNLLVYGFARTDKIPPGSVEHSFLPNSTTMRVEGRLTMSNGSQMLNTPINIIVAPSVSGSPDMSGAMTTQTTTGGVSVFNGNGYFNVVMTGPLAPESSHFILIRHQGSGNDIIEPILITVPEINIVDDTDNGDNDVVVDIPEPEYNGLITCDGGGADPCDFYDIISTINRIIDFLIKYIAFPLVAIVVAWAGIKLLVSGGSSEAKSSAKKMIGKVVIGLIIALLSWVIIKLILVTLGYVPNGPLWSLFGINPN